MGLSRTIFELAKRTLPLGKMLSFGYPDALFSEPGICPSMHGDAIRRTHGIKGEFADTVSLFASAGWSMTALDSMPSRGCEREHDLNNPLPVDLIDSFDCVLDVGTGEHVFNIAQVFVSALQAVRVGGAILMEHPLVHCNHGFWCTQPTAMLDFFSANGCDVHAWTHAKGVLTKIDSGRFSAPDKTQSVCVAIKRDVVSLRWPTQSRFL